MGQTGAKLWLCHPWRGPGTKVPAGTGGVDETPSRKAPRPHLVQCSESAQPGNAELLCSLSPGCAENLLVWMQGVQALSKVLWALPWNIQELGAPWENPVLSVWLSEKGVRESLQNNLSEE